MPIYDYMCRDCRTYEVKIKKIEERDLPEECSLCGKPMERSLGGGVTLRGNLQKGYYNSQVKERKK
jgi:putative FmdB family regulatory protein